MELATFLLLSLMGLMILISPLGVVSPSAILAGSWGVVYALQTVFASDMRGSFLASVSIFLITLAFSVGEIVGCKGIKFENQINIEKLSSSLNDDGQCISERDLARLIFFLGILSIAGAMQYANTLGLLEAKSFAELLVLPGLAREEIFEGTLDVPLISRVGFLISYSGVILALAYYFFYRWRWFLVLPIVAVLLLGMSQSGRAGILIVLLQSMITIYFKNVVFLRRSFGDFLLRSLTFPFLLILVIFVGGQFLREGFESSDSGDVFRVIQSLRAYLFGGVSAFSYWIDDMYDVNLLTFGVYSFSSLFAVLGLHPQASGVFDFYSPIAASGETSNLYTAYRSFIEDFSIFGACIFYFLSGFFISSISISFIRGKVALIFILIPVLSWLAFSPLYSLTYFNSFILSCIFPYFLVQNFKGSKNG